MGSDLPVPLPLWSLRACPPAGAGARAGCGSNLGDGGGRHEELQPPICPEAEQTVFDEVWGAGVRRKG